MLLNGVDQADQLLGPALTQADAFGCCPASNRVEQLRPCPHERPSVVQLRTPEATWEKLAYAIRAIEFSVQSVFPARVNAAGDAWVSNLDNRDGK